MREGRSTSAQYKIESYKNEAKMGVHDALRVLVIKGQFFKYRKEKRKEKSLRGRGGGLRRSGGAPGADLACKRHRHVQSWLLESPNFL